MQKELWYVYQKSEQSGPFSHNQIQKMLISNMISQNAFLFKSGWKDWRPLADCTSEFQDTFVPPPPPNISQPMNRPPRATISGQIIVHNNGQLIIAAGVNISSNGIFVETDKEIFRLGEILKLTCRVSGLSRAFNVEAEVIRFNRDPANPVGYGLCFTSIADSVVSEIRSLIEGRKIG